MASRAGGAEPRLPHQTYLDCLRGIAALYVVGYHLVLLPNPNLAVPDWISRFVKTGGTGVTLFFVVSAFSLCYTWPGHERTGMPLTSFFVKRVFRIAPVFYLVLLLSLIRDRLFFNVDHGPIEVLMNATFLFNWWPGHQEGVAWASWTIGVEVMFYATFPFLYRWASNLPRSVALLAIALMLTEVTRIVAGAFLPPERLSQFMQWTVFRHLPIFVIGIIAFHLVTLGAARIVNRRDWGFALTAVAVWAYFSLIGGRFGSWLFESYPWQGVIYACLLLGLAFHPMGLFVNRVTAFFGRISYSVYLLHANLIVLSIPVFRWIYSVVPETAAFFVCYAWAVLATAVPAWIVYRWLELPGVRMGAKVLARIRRGKGLALST